MLDKQTKPAKLIAGPEHILYSAESIPAGRIHFIVDGITPLLTHNPESMGTVKGPSKESRIPEPEVEAEAGLYRMEDGTCAIKGESFRGATLNASSAFKGAKRTTMKSVLSHITVVEELVPLMLRDGTPISSYVIDRRRVRVQRAGIIRARPKFMEWSAEFTFEFDPLLVREPKIICDILQDGGNRFGVGDYRPQCGGSFGRFRLREYWLD
jgi:hypothetical protein